MEEIYTWVKQIIIYLCLLELICQLIPGQNYRRYVRFFGSVIFVISVLRPLLSAFSVEDVFDRALQRAFVQEEAMRLEEVRENLAGLQSREIMIAYENELRRQVREIVETANERVLRIKFLFEEGTMEPSTLQKMEIVLAKKSSAANVFEEETGDTAAQQAAVNQIRTELAAIYGLHPAQIDISIKE